MIYKISCQICGDHFDASKIAGYNDSVSVSGDGIVTCDGEPFGTDCFRQDCEKKILDFIQNNETTLLHCGAEKCVIRYEMHYSLQCNGEILSPETISRFSRINLPIEIILTTKEYPNNEAFEEWERRLWEKREE